MNRSKSSLLFACAAWAALAGPPLAEAATPQEYNLELPASQLVAYKIEFEVDHPGPVVLEADWDGSRVVSFRLEGPRTEQRRTGPPPQRIEFDVEPGLAAGGGTWRVSIRSLPSREAARGKLLLTLPGPAPAPPTAAPPVVRGPEPTEDPWRVAVATPGGLRTEVRRFFASTERYRQLVVDPAGAPDGYHWQEPLLRFLALRREELGSGKPATLSPSTFRLLERIAEAVRAVDALRNGEDPVIGRRPPQDRLELRRWLAQRRDRIRPVERRLDDLLSDLEGGHAPELEHEGWLRRWLSCLTVCERHFEERGRVGVEMARYRDVADDQWSRMLAAADAVESLLAADQLPIRIG